MRRSARTVNFLVVCSLTSGLAACASVSDERLKSEVSALIGKDHFAAMAMAHLEKAGFICTVGNPTDVECSRLRMPNILTSCIQRVIVVDGRIKNEFSGVSYRPPACFGGFG
jgi:hypothetical protein